ncbi:MAG: cold-shock protein [Alphaproteobacteria bacterium]
MNWSRDTDGRRRRRTRESWDDSPPDMGFPPRAVAREPSFSQAPRPPRAPGGDAPAVDRAGVTATVKWFNGQKGFGFVTLAEGGPDAFLHVSALQRAGLSEVPEGTTLTCDIGRGQRGPQVVAVHEVDASTAVQAERPRRDFGNRDAGYGDQEVPTGPLEGTVKWFNAEKGFGFITPDGGGKDVFVHIKAVQRAGLDTLEAGDRVSVTTQAGRKGPEVASITVI